VIKGFPAGDKVPDALLKQGMSFQKLGDKASAKIVYQQIINKYPRPIRPEPHGRNYQN